MKRLLAIILFVSSLIAVAVFPVSAEEAHERFTDVPEGKWYTSAIDWICEQGYMTGTSETEFSPNAPLTREDLIKAIMHRFQYEIIPHYEEYSFSDLDPNEEYSDLVEYAYRNGWLAGVGNGKFGVGLPIRRQDAAVLLYNLLTWGRHPPEYYTPEHLLFGCEITDLDKVSSYARYAVLNLSSYIDFDYLKPGLPEFYLVYELPPLFVGNKNHEFMPNKYMTRAELACAIRTHNLPLNFHP